MELRANLGLYRSQRRQACPAPTTGSTNRPRRRANLGADYRLRGLPLTLGGNFNWVPAYHHAAGGRPAPSPSAAKRRGDAYALWTFSPAVGLRLLASNLVPRDLRHREPERQRQPGQRPAERTRVVSGGPTYTNWQLRLELKL